MKLATCLLLLATAAAPAFAVCTISMPPTTCGSPSGGHPPKKPPPPPKGQVIQAEAQYDCRMSGSCIDTVKDEHYPPASLFDLHATFEMALNQVVSLF